MIDYYHFTADDFMQDPSFRAWVQQSSPEATAFWTDWLREHPDKSAAMQQAKEWLEALWSGFDELSEAELQAHLDALKTERATRRLVKTKAVVQRRIGWLGWSAAASVGLAVLSWWIWRENAVTKPAGQVVLSYREAIGQVAASQLREVVNATSRPRRVALPDGSFITLHPRSKISYEARLGQQPQRTVYLTGEAFFEVARQPSRPFMVYANGLITKVLGTSFLIRAYENKANVTVTVRTGRVSVFAPRRASPARPVFSELEDGIVLTPNQQAVYSLGAERDAERLVRSLVPRPVLLHPEKIRPGTVFTDAPLSQILRQFEEAYGVDILYDEALFRDCLLTARLYDEPLLDKLTLICKTIGASYEVVDGRIIVSGPGCG